MCETVSVSSGIRGYLSVQPDTRAQTNPASSEREISNFLSNITEHFHHFLLVISRFILFSANIIISIRPVHLGHWLASNFPLIFQELAAEWRGLAISSHPDLVMRAPSGSSCLFLLVFSVTKFITQPQLMLSYHLVFNQKSIIAPLDIGDEEINLNRRWILNRERDSHKKSEEEKLKSRKFY